MASIFEATTRRILELIERDGALPWNRPWRCSSPRNALSGRRYRGVNRLMLGLAEHTDPRWLTLRQANELGGRVLKGERGTQIALWKWIEDENGVERPITRTFTVFNLQQCDGLSPLDEEPSTPSDPIASAEAIIAGYVGAPQVVHGGDRAYYAIATDTIFMPERGRFVSPEGFYATHFHECVHSSGAAHRLARPGVTGTIEYGSALHSVEEMTAELGAAFLCSEARIEGQIDQSAAYVASWSRAIQRDATMIVRAAAQAQKAADYILGRDEGTEA